MTTTNEWHYGIYPLFLAPFRLIYGWCPRSSLSATRTSGGPWKSLKDAFNSLWTNHLIFRIVFLILLVISIAIPLVYLTVIYPPLVYIFIPISIVDCFLELWILQRGVSFREQYWWLYASSKQIIQNARVVPKSELLYRSALSSVFFTVFWFFNAYSSNQIAFTRVWLIISLVHIVRSVYYSKILLDQKKYSVKKLAPTIGLSLIVLAALIGGRYASTQSSTFTIQVQSNTSWAGEIYVSERSTPSKHLNVSNLGNMSYQIIGYLVVVDVQKQTDLGYLTVTIFREGKFYNNQTTSSPYGKVHIAGS